MAIPASSVVKSAATILQDESGIRWPAAELVEWMNAGQREIQMYRPDATARTLTGSLQAGDRQTLTGIPEVATLNPLRLVGISRNQVAGRAGGAISEAQRAELDAVDPYWASSIGSADIEHFMFDARDPNAFYVYPPALSSAKVEITVSVAPVDVAAPSGTTYTSVVGNISVADSFANALLDYVLHRAYLKDTEFAGDVARAVAHYNAFGNALGIELKSGLMVAPTGNTASKL